MADDDALRAALTAGVPTPPAAPDRAAGARGVARRLRRRRTTGVVVATVLVVALVAAVPVLVGRDQPAPTYAGNPADLSCPAYSRDVTDRGPDTVSDDLVAARLCSGPGSGYPEADTVLTTGLDRIPPLVNDAADYDEEHDCTMEGGRGFLLQLLHADGTTQAVSGELYGCEVMTVGGTRRLGAQALYDTVQHLYTEQGTAIDPGCPADVAEPPATDDSRLPTGATAARLCEGPGSPVQVPLDHLTVGVDELVATVNDTPLHPDDACLRDGGPVYRLYFDYADGPTQVVTLELRGCRSATFGGSRHDDPQLVLDRFVSLLRAQRDGRTPPDEIPESTCPSSDRGSIVARATEMVKAILCVQYEADRPRPDRSVAIAPRDLVVLLADLDDPGSRQRPMGGCGFGPTITLVGRSAWGDPLSQGSYCGGTWVVGDTFVPMSAASLAIVDRLVLEAGGEPPPRVTSDTSPEALIPAYVDVHNLGLDDEAGRLWVDAGSPEIATRGTRIGFDLVDVTPTTVPGWPDAYAVSGTYREGADAAGDDVTFIVVRPPAGGHLRILRVDG